MYITPKSMFEEMLQQMLENLKSSVLEKFAIEERSKTPDPVGPFQVIRSFSLTDKPLTREWVVEFNLLNNPLVSERIYIDQDSWRIESSDIIRFEDIDGRKVRLFEIPEPESKECLLVCRAQIKTANLQKEARLNLGVERPFEFLGMSSGTHFTKWYASVSGTTEWKTYEVRYHFKKQQQSGKIRVEIEFQSSGILWIKDVKILQAPV